MTLKQLDDAWFLNLYHSSLYCVRVALRGEVKASTICLALKPSKWKNVAFFTYKGVVYKKNNNKKNTIGGKLNVKD